LPRIVRGQGRDQTFALFRKAVRTAKQGVLPLLLVDSEAPVKAGHTVWQHLRAHGNGEQPTGTADGQAFLMVQIMETWFLSDPAALRRYFGNKLHEKHIKKGRNLEEIPKHAVLDALKKTTARCNPPYAKGRIAFGLLSKLDPRAVEEACPHAGAFLERLRKTSRAVLPSNLHVC